MQQRLCGREQEFGVWLDSKDPAGSKTTQAIIKMILKTIPDVWVETLGHNPMDVPNYPPSHPGPSAYCGEWLWCRSGWKIYEDQKLLEVASAESLAGSLDAVAQEKAMERVLNRVIRRLRRQAAFSHLALYKKNVSLRYAEPQSAYRGPMGHGGYEGYPTNYSEEPAKVPARKEEKEAINLADEVSYGSHHNYSYLAKRQKRIFRLFRNFIPASLPLTGNGHILRVGKFKERCLYVLSQRAAHINQIISAEGVLEGIGRALINKRSRHYWGADKRFGRLHLVSRDATRCEFQTWLVDAVTHLVLRLAEEGWNLPAKLQLRNPVATLHLLNQSPDLNCRISTFSGRKDVIAYNQIFLKAARKLRPLSAMEKKALEEWARVLELLKARAWKKLVGELDWATKRFLIETKMKEQGFGLDSLKAWHLDQEYHNISSNPKESWFARMDEAGLIRHLVTEKQIRRAMLHPPETRARTRGDLIALCLRNKTLAKKLEFLDWDMAGIKIGKDISYLYFGHPNNSFLPQKDPLEKLIKGLKKLKKSA